MACNGLCQSLEKKVDEEVNLTPSNIHPGTQIQEASSSE